MERPSVIGIKSGTFTLLHPGHVWMLKICKAHCDHLIVLTNSDDYLMRKKGVVPINLQGRIRLLESIKYVDQVSWFEGDTEDKWIRDFKNNLPDSQPRPKIIVFHSLELYGKPNIPAQDCADEIIYIPRIDGSTTRMFKIIKGESVCKLDPTEYLW